MISYLFKRPAARRAGNCAILAIVALGSTACTQAVRSVAMENRIFVRVPGKIIKAPEPSFGWSFRHVVEGPKISGTTQQWYVAYRTNDRRDRLYHFPFTVPWRHARAMAPELADACFKSFNAYPTIIEPGLVFSKWASKVRIDPNNVLATENTPELEVGAAPLAVWPSVRTKDGKFYDPLWYKDGDHTQLDAARERAQREAPERSRAIVIAHLDTGFDNRHAAMPTNLEEDVAGDAMQALRPEYDSSSDGRATPGQSHGGHGMGSLGILAGRSVRLVDRKFTSGSMKVPGDGKVLTLGAAPEAKIVGVRVAPWVASFSTANLAYGIDYASRQKKADIISMSHGGSPSQMWTDAVNAAYERGTAIFAATGDYFALPIPGRMNRMGFILPPSSTVYPAGYRRVMGVSGATARIGADGIPRPYALTDWRRFLTHFWNPSGIMHHFMRGSYGGDGVRRSFLFGSEKRELSRVDTSLSDRRNTLRSYPISTYSPAIPWLAVGKKRATTAPNGIELSGAGTSAAAPQAAGAAAHWLALYRPEIERAGTWNRWEKVEALFTAMIHAAWRPWSTNESDPDNQSPNIYLGAGLLKANDMLDVSYKQATAIHGETLSFPYADRAKTGVQFDFYDGDRSFFASVIKANRKPSEAHKERVNLRVEKYSNREDALRQLYFNMLLIDKWQHAKNPVKVANETNRSVILDLILNTTQHESQLDARADALAKKAPPTPDQPKSTMLGRFFSRLIR